MSRVRAPLALLLLLTTGVAFPVLAQESGVAPPGLAADAGVSDVPSSDSPTLETEHKHLLEYTTVPITGPTCVSSAECAAKVGYGEVCVDGACREYEDATDLFTLLHMTNAGKVTPKPFELLPAILPAVGYNPALGFLIGVTAFLGMYLGDPEDTTISNAQPTFLYTSLNQVVFQMVSTIMTSSNEWELQGDYRFLIYNQNTYGLGTGVTPVSGGINIGGYGQTAAVPGAQPMDFDLLRFHQSVLKKVVGYLYLGGALRFDRYYNINDQLLNLTSSPPVITSSYAYSRYYGFNSNQYNIVSVGAEALYDSRDSTIDPYRGVCEPRLPRKPDLAGQFERQHSRLRRIPDILWARPGHSAKPDCGVVHRPGRHQRRIAIHGIAGHRLGQPRTNGARVRRRSVSRHPGNLRRVRVPLSYYR